VAGATVRVAERAKSYAAVAAITTLWLVALDRAGMARIDAEVWCGFGGLWLLFSGHFALSLVAALAIGAVVAVGSRGSPRWRKLRGSALAIALMLITVGPFFTPSGEASPLEIQFLAVQLVVLIVAIGLATFFYTARPRRWWHHAPWAVLSFAVSWFDATTYPGLFPDLHLIAYFFTVLTGAVGIGVPAAAWLEHRGGILYGWGLPTFASLLALGLALLFFAGRTRPAEVSLQLLRLVRKLPDPEPPSVLVQALSQPIVETPDTPAPAFPRGKDRWSVLLVTVDALRADALLEVPKRGFYLQPSDTPFLDRWLSTGFRFRAAYSQSNATVRSFRSMFEAVGPADPVGGAGVPQVARALDLTTVAVVPPFFVQEERYRTGIFEFDHFDAYDLDRQEEQLERVEDALTAVASERFFMWTHFYALHDPVYSDRGPGKFTLIKTAAEAARVYVQYREGLRWFDRQFERVIKALQASGVARSTIVIIAADHGEHVGEGLHVGHADGMHSTDLHVPLIVSVPDTPGTVIESVVGNMDILPTIVDLLGGDNEPTHRGRSLVPLMQHTVADSGRWYYAHGSNNGHHAVVAGNDIFAYDEKLGAFQRFDRRDPLALARKDFLGSDRARDATLTALMVRGNQNPFARELDSPRVRSILRERILTANTSSDADLEFLLSLAAGSSDTEIRAAIETATLAATSVDRKLRIIRHVLERDSQHWLPVLEKLLVRSLRTSAEKTTVESFVHYDVPLVAGPLVAQRLQELAGSDDFALIDAWLSFVRTRSKAPAFAAPLAALAAKHRAVSAGDSRRTRALLESVATLEIPATKRRDGGVPAIAAWVRQLVQDPRVSTAQHACRALGAVGTEADIGLLDGIVNGRASRGVRSAALRGLTRLRGAPVTPYLKDRVRDPVLAVTALDELAKLGDEAIAAWLDSVAKTQKGALKYVTAHSAKRVRWRVQVTSEIRKNTGNSVAAAPVNAGPNVGSP
jgi:hypothetical protein